MYVLFCLLLHTDRHIDRHIDRQTDRQTDRHIDRQTDGQTDTHTHRQTDRQTDRRGRVLASDAGYFVSHCRPHTQIDHTQTDT